MKVYLEALEQILKISFSIILAILLPAVVFTMVVSKTSVVNGIQSFVVLTGSMTPNYPVGSVVYTIPSPSYKVGDVIAFKEGPETITHRIIAVTAKGYQTRGDANNEADSKIVDKSAVIGGAFFRVLNAGKLILALRTIQGFVLLLVVPTLIFIGFELMHIKKEIEKETEKRVLSSLRGSMESNRGNLDNMVSI